MLERREVPRQLVEERRAASLRRPIGRVQAAGGAGEQRGGTKVAAGGGSDSLAVAGPQAAHAVTVGLRAGSHVRPQFASTAAPRVPSFVTVTS